jgi:hypothetical protein
MRAISFITATSSAKCSTSVIQLSSSLVGRFTLADLDRVRMRMYRAKAWHSRLYGTVVLLSVKLLRSNDHNVVWGAFWALLGA